MVYAGYGRAASTSPIRIRITASFSYRPATSCLLEASVSIIDACWKRLEAMASLLGGLAVQSLSPENWISVHSPEV